MPDSFAAFWTYDVIRQREEQAQEAECLQKQDNRIDQRPSVREQLLGIRSQIYALLLQIDEERDEWD